MTPDQARRWIIIASLAITGAQLIFLLVAPAVGFPIQYPKNLDLLQIIMPVFLGYLGSAAHFVFMNPPPTVHANNEFLSLLVKGPIGIYTASQIAAFGAFWYSNREGAPIGGGMSIDTLTTTMSVLLGILAATTAIVVSYLFAAPHAGTAPPEAERDKAG